MQTQYGSLREKIAAETAARKSRYAEFETLYAAAEAAGNAAGNAATPQAMTVIGHGESYFVADGACGFAWVIVRPATSSFGRWLIRTGKGRKAYEGGVQIWVDGYRQSMQRKEAHAAAFTKVLRDAGIDASSRSRMD